MDPDFHILNEQHCIETTGFERIAIPKQLPAGNRPIKERSEEVFQHQLFSKAGVFFPHEKITAWIDQKGFTLLCPQTVFSLYYALSL